MFFTKNILKFLLLTIFCLAAVSANSQGFEYYGSIADANGKPGMDRQISLQFDVTDNAGKIIYSEIHDNLTADKNGMFHAVVGEGVAQTGDFDKIDWSDNGIYIDIEFTRPDGSVIKDSQPLAYVPKALGADYTNKLVSKANEQGRYVLKVDDNGNLTPAFEETNLIPIPEGYTKILFHDEFNEDGMVNPDFWGFEKGYVRNGEMQYYTEARPENLIIEDGLLKIITCNDNYIDEEGVSHAITSASVTTQDKVKFTYGRVDVRAKLPVCLGSWPAIWMMPNDNVFGYWPNSGEIDIMEHVGYNPYSVYFTAHCAEQNGNDNKYHNSTSLPDCNTEFHVYSLEWSQNRLDWLIDGKRKWTVVKNSNSWRGWPFNQDFYLILNTAFGGSWGGQRGVDLDALPITYEIDYVRIFQ